MTDCLKDNSLRELRSVREMLCQSEMFVYFYIDMKRCLLHDDVMMGGVLAYYVMNIHYVGKRLRAFCGIREDNQDLSSLLKVGFCCVCGGITIIYRLI